MTVRLRHYEDGSAYSGDENEHPFKLLRCWLGVANGNKEDWENGCMLFSDNLIMHASIVRETEN